MLDQDQPQQILHIGRYRQRQQPDGAAEQLAVRDHVVAGNRALDLGARDNFAHHDAICGHIAEISGIGDPAGQQLLSSAKRRTPQQSAGIEPLQQRDLRRGRLD